MNSPDDFFYVAGGTLRHDAASYVERPADQLLCQALLAGEFCYVLTSRQMGKSSLMVRTATKLRQQGHSVIVIDLTALGQNVSADQWYDGLMVRMGTQLGMESLLDDFWRSQIRLGPLQRVIAALQQVILPSLKTRGLNRAVPGGIGAKVLEPDPGGLPLPRLVIFIDEIDTVRSLPFSSDEFFSAIRECHNRRTQEPEFNRLTFCLLGVATPSQLIRDHRTTPFNVGRRIELTDFTEGTSMALAEGIGVDRGTSGLIFSRIFHWTSGHPYLTQRLFQGVAHWKSLPHPKHSPALSPIETVDQCCADLFFSPRARERDDNLLFVRERILRTQVNLVSLLELYEKVRNNEKIRDDETDDLINELHLSGLVRVRDGYLTVRNRIYSQVFDAGWIKANMPVAEIETANGERIRIKGSCSLGRVAANDLPLPDEKVSRRHALIQIQEQNDFWLADLGSRNGTFLNGRRVTQAVRLRDQDRIEIGQFRLIFHQPNAKREPNLATVTSGITIQDIQSFNGWLIVASEEPFNPGPLPKSDEQRAAPGGWFAQAKKILAETNGTFSEPTKSGFLAYWPEAHRGGLLRALEQLKELQGEAMPNFRIVLHYGQIFKEGAGSAPPGALRGKEVTFVCQLDKLAATVREPRLLSETAMTHLKAKISVTGPVRYPLPGSEGECSCYKW